MYIKSLEIEGYRSFGQKITVDFNPGLTVLAGENGCGKSSVIDALRLLLAEDEYGRSGVEASDFHRGFDKGDIPASQISIRGTFAGLKENEQIAFLPWLDSKSVETAYLNLSILNKESLRGRYKRQVWGGDSTLGAFEWELLDSINCIYLPALRDAPGRLRAYRGSRLARLLKKLQMGLTEDQIKDQSEKFQRLNNLMLKDSVIEDANEKIRSNQAESLGSIFGQDVKIQIAEGRFDRVVEQMRILFFPEILEGERYGETASLFRELEENSLGLNNLIYISTVLAELGSVNSENEFLGLLLVEEPEAHLHPQLQMKLLRYLESRSERDGFQVIVTTHSPVLTASLELSNLSVMVREKAPSATLISNLDIDLKSSFFLRRWLDVTKSTYFFSRGILLVEGIAEALVVSELAKIFLQDNRFAMSSLVDYGISIINMNGVYVKHFMAPFRDVDMVTGKNRPYIPIKCAALTDCDPKDKETSRPTTSEPCDCGNRQSDMSINSTSQNCRVYSNLKTFEYDLALEGANLSLMADVYRSILDSEAGSNYARATDIIEEDWSKVDEGDKVDCALWLLNHIDAAGKGVFAQALAHRLFSEPNLQMKIPKYIKDALEWLIPNKEFK